MNLDLVFYRAILLRRLPVMMLFILLLSGLGFVTAFNLPETYSTSARLLVESSQIPDAMFTSTVVTDPAEQLEVIEQRLMTRANLIDIANRYNVFEEMRAMEADLVVTQMRTSTQIRRSSGGRGAGAMMTISFDARAPQIAANVVNEYVTLVLQESSSFRASRAENTLQFFQQEVDRLDEELTRQSVEIARFKSENADALPQDRGFRLQRVSLLQERLERLAQELSFSRQQRETLELRLDAAGQPNNRIAEEEELLISRAELERLQETYNDTNPRILRLKERIEQLNAIVAARKSVSDTVDEGGVVSLDQALRDATLEDADRRIQSMQEQIDTTTAELEELNKNISQSTANEFQLSELERDNAILQSRYDSAVSNLNSARMSERIESTSQGQRFSVLESASVPQIPSGPNRPAIAAGGVFLGIALAAGYFILLEVLNRDIRRPAEIAERFNITPIATIPYMESRAEKFFRRSALVTMTLAVLIGVPIALWYVDTHYLPLELLVQRGLAKVGLG